MPIFEYICDACEKRVDKLVTRTQVEEGVEFECECEQKGTLKKSEAPVAASLRFKGKWYTTTRGY